MNFLYLKSLHIIFVTTWFAGLFYIVRLFIYHSEASLKSSPEKEILSNQYKIMEKRLWYIITVPSAILTGILGPSMIHHFTPLSSSPWLILKLVLVSGLYIYHFLCMYIFKKFQNDEIKFLSNQLRIWNEVATLFLFSIVFLVVLKDSIDMIKGVIALISLSLVLMIGIKLYKKIRS